MLELDCSIAAGEDFDVLADVVDIEQAGFNAIIQICGEVGDLVGEVDQLGFERRALVEEIFGEVWMLIDAIVTRVLDDSLADPEREVEATMSGVALLEVLDDAKGVEVVVEAAPMTAQAAIERTLASVAKGRMTDIVNESEGFGEILVEAKHGGDCTRDLGYLNGMSEPAAKMIGGAAGEDLSLACETAEGTSLHDAFAITLEGRTRRAEGHGIDTGQERIVRVSGDRAPMKIDWHGRVKCIGRRPGMLYALSVDPGEVDPGINGQQRYAREEKAERRSPCSLLG
jgi:hypothetical protein